MITIKVWKKNKEPIVLNEKLPDSIRERIKEIIYYYFINNEDGYHVSCDIGALVFLNKMPVNDGGIYMDDISDNDTLDIIEMSSDELSKMIRKTARTPLQYGDIEHCS